jgi:hypothetical protein
MATRQCLGAKNACALSFDSNLQFASFELRRSADGSSPVIMAASRNLKKPTSVNKN